MPSPAWAVFRAAARRPGMIPDLVSSAWAFRRRGWYRRPPFLPLPSTAYLQWRMDTAYGDPDAVPPTDELRRYLRWARTMRRMSGAAGALPTEEG